jgi:hypothetical protein
VAAALLVALVAGGGFAWHEHGREQTRLAKRQQTEREVTGLRAEARGLRESALRMEPALRKEQLSHALGLLERAAALLDEGDDPALRQDVDRELGELRQARRDQEMRLRLEQARLEGATVSRFGDSEGFDYRQTVKEYRAAFAWYLGVADPLALSPEDMAQRLGAQAIAGDLAAALDDWSIRADRKEGWIWTRGVASRLDDDPLRRQIRDGLGNRDGQKLVKLARSADLGGQPAATPALLGRVLLNGGQVEAAERVLRLGQQTYPGDFWLNHDLGICLGKVKPAKHEEAVRFLTAAVALRSLSPRDSSQPGRCPGRPGQRPG